MTRSSVIRRLRDERGAVLPFLGFMLMVLAGFAALAIDVGHLYVTRAKLQGAADAAALAAVLNLPNQQTARSAAITYAVKNLDGAIQASQLQGDQVVLGGWDLASRTFLPNASPADAVRVTLSLTEASGNPVQTFFARVLGIETVDVSVTAIARAARPPICVLALDPSGTGIDVHNSTITANGCVVHANSTGATAITGQVNGVITAEMICPVGGYGSRPTYTPTPEADCPVVADPLLNLTPPAVGACDHTGYSYSSTTGNVTLSEGVYCNGVTITTGGTVTLQPGTYIFKDSQVKIAGGAKLVGNNVLLYFVGSSPSSKSWLDAAGSSSVTLSAPATGPHAGIVFYADRSLPTDTTHAFKGGSSVHYEGSIYAPTSIVQFNGNGSATINSPFSIFVARQFRFSGGNAEIRINTNYDSSGVPVPGSLGARSPRLVM